ncbi:MAG: EAL domain-containing protein, partial [Oscillibacter sp.]|nr:EAL domain-containing protein [Oscillibacter sp.]
DFSMGQTSINYLKDSTFDHIKLDGSLVRGLFTHQNCREIISSITQLADSLNLSVLAEYVETAEQRDLLHEIGCDCYQGYLYSPAVPIREEDKE